MSLTGQAPTSRRRPLLTILNVFHIRAVFIRCLTVLLCSLPAVSAGGDSRAVPNLVAAMAFGYASVGALNDYCDRDLDRQTKPWRAIPSGLVSPSLALGLGLVCVGGMLASAWPLGPLSVSMITLATAMGWLYDVGLKRTVLSWLPFVVFFPLMPLWTWFSLKGFEPRLWGLFPLITPAAFAMHLFNNLEDVENDRAAGWTGGLPHRLGRRRSSWLAWSTLLAGYLAFMGWLVCMPPGLRLRFSLLVLSAIVLSALAGAVLVFYNDRPPVRRIAYTLLAVSVMILTTGFPVTLN